MWRQGVAASENKFENGHMLQPVRLDLSIVSQRPYPTMRWRAGVAGPHAGYRALAVTAEKDRGGLRKESTDGLIDIHECASFGPARTRGRNCVWRLWNKVNALGQFVPRGWGP